MTASELYKNTVSMWFEEDDSYKRYCLPHINALLTECFGTNNSIRVWQGKAALPEIPLIASMDSEIEYEPSLLHTALPYGLASKIVYDDGDMNKVIFWQNKYVEALQDARRAELTEVEDVYR